MKKIELKKDNCILRSIERKDVYGNWWKWFNDPDVTAYMNKGQFKNTIEKQLEFYEKIKKSNTDFVLAICDAFSKNSRQQPENADATDSPAIAGRRRPLISMTQADLAKL